MRSQTFLCLFASITGHVSATGILLPLYIYPSQVFNDGAVNWQPARTAMSSHPSVQWLAVINPDSGPGGTRQPGNADTNYITGVSQLNALPNVRTIGYVHTSFSTAPMTELQANITTWKNWATASSNISVDGIFFDETSADFTYLSNATAFARQAFGSRPITVVCNFGTAATAQFYTICDVVVAFESCLNCPDGPPYASQSTISANIPSGKQAQAAILVHDFSGTAHDGSTANAGLLTQYVDTLVGDGVGWCYFTSAGYDTITTAPATVSALAADVASA
ncbi:putative cell surface spherulin 4-like protein [Mycena venus]|uniref:Putative cell surface spherulin 4-like protein n=1 Tax=Mycena venus TaxID=2733690 RepID=A0A8H7D5G5_9AGAR|nr:putative cell surface spherulin 4-like protein [Mycena venus]